jgi:hypothetical protein
MLFDPGTVISARTGLSSGTISMRSGKGMKIVTALQHYSVKTVSGDRLLTL